MSRPPITPSRPHHILSAVESSPFRQESIPDFPLKGAFGFDDTISPLFVGLEPNAGRHGERHHPVGRCTFQFEWNFELAQIRLAHTNYAIIKRSALCTVREHCNMRPIPHSGNDGFPLNAHARSLQFFADILTDMSLHLYKHCKVLVTQDWDQSPLSIVMRRNKSFGLLPMFVLSRGRGSAFLRRSAFLEPYKVNQAIYDQRP